MSEPAYAPLKRWPHSRIELHFMKMCALLPYGGTLRGFGKRLGVRIRGELDPIRWAIMDAIFQEECLDDDAE